MIRVIGIDPGTIKIGYGIIDFDDKNNKFYLVKYGLLELKESFSYKKLNRIYEEIEKIAKEFNPNFIAIENQFLGRNVQTLIKLTQAKTAIILGFQSKNKDIVIEEYAPCTIKSTMIGKGNATKEEVVDVVNKILNIKIGEKDLDISDSLAVALCHIHKIYGKYFI